MATSSRPFRVSFERASSFALHQRSAGAEIPLLKTAPLLLALFAGTLWFAYSKGVELAQSRGPETIVRNAGAAAPPSNAAPSQMRLRPGEVFVAPVPRPKPVK